MSIRMDLLRVQLRSSCAHTDGRCSDADVRRQGIATSCPQLPAGEDAGAELPWTRCQVHYAKRLESFGHKSTRCNVEMPGCHQIAASMCSVPGQLRSCRAPQGDSCDTTKRPPATSQDEMLLRWVEYRLPRSRVSRRSKTLQQRPRRRGGRRCVSHRVARRPPLLAT
jgi:hypothetical protein